MEWIQLAELAVRFALAVHEPATVLTFMAILFALTLTAAFWLLLKAQVNSSGGRRKRRGQ